MAQVPSPDHTDLDLTWHKDYLEHPVYTFANVLALNCSEVPNLAIWLYDDVKLFRTYLSKHPEA